MYPRQMGLLLLIGVVLAYADNVPAARSSARCQDNICQFRLSSGNDTSTTCVKTRMSPIEVQVPYQCNNFTSVCRVAVSTPGFAGRNGTSVGGFCGNNRTASLNLSWSKGNFQLMLHFQQRTFYSSQIMTSIAAYNFVGHLVLKVNLRDPVFVNASINKGAAPLESFVNLKTVYLFASPLGMEYSCKSPETVKLHRLANNREIETDIDDAVAMVTFPAVDTEAFRSTAPTGGLLDGPFLCEADSNKQARSVAILVISGVLGVGLFVIVCGFLGTRLNNKNSGYSSVD